MHISKKPLLIGLIFISFFVFLFLNPFKDKKSYTNNNKVYEYDTSTFFTKKKDHKMKW